jgi:hypothetical protein
LLLLALQTTAAASDDRRIDVITLVLVVIFLVSMAALSVLLFRRTGEEASERPATVPPPEPNPARAPSFSPARRERPLPVTDPVPAWLQGVIFSSGDASLADAASVIEALLSARRDHDLAGGLRLYSKELLDSLRTSLGVDEAGLVEALNHAQFDGDPPTLRSLDLIGSSSNHMTVRAGYTSSADEVYRLVRLGGQWLIEGIALS